MSGEFGEDFKPNTKGVEGAKSEEASDKHDPFGDVRSLKGSDTAKSEKVESGTLSSSTDKQLNKAMCDKDADRLAKDHSPEEIMANLEKLMASINQKLKASHHFDAEVASATKEQVQSFYANLAKIDKNRGNA